MVGSFSGGDIRQRECFDGAPELQDRCIMSGTGRHKVMVGTFWQITTKCEGGRGKLARVVRGGTGGGDAEKSVVRPCSGLPRESRQWCVGCGGCAVEKSAGGGLEKVASLINGIDNFIDRCRNLRSSKTYLMAEKIRELIVPEEVIISKIYYIRGHKVMLDEDLAELYEVLTKHLKRQVRRNIDRFPDDFMFELTKEEFENLRSQIGTSNWGGVRYMPMVFTEQGVAMLSSILNSARAIKVNIQIIRIFTRMREILLNYKDLLLKLEQLEKKVSSHDEDIQLVFAYLKKLLPTPEQVDRRRIGLRRSDEA